MVNRKHYVIFFENDQLIHTTPMDWARNNPEAFPKYNFDVEMPTPNKISSYLVKELSFTRIENENCVVTIQL
tara:strand:- start:949 stop:1164 length:216 start_codon:yes stop_codon:yes gene_type:complete